MASLLMDLRSSARALAAARGFASMAIVTLGLGMALCAVTVVVIDAYLLRDLPYPAADRLYWVRVGGPDQPPPRDLATRDWSSLDATMEQQIAWDLDMFYLVGREHTEQARGAWVTPGFMDGFGIRPALGRGFDAQAFVPGGPNVALISHALWTARFGGDPAAIGQTFTAYVSDRPAEAEQFTIVGVLPPQAWHFNPYMDVLVPLRVSTYPYMVRLREHVTLQEAAARLGALVNDRSGPSVPVHLESAHERHTASLRPVLRAAMAAATLVLLVACANVAALLLVRATGREKELAVRVALGAGRLALARTLTAEAVLVVASATALALLTTTIGLAWLGQTLQEQVGRSAPGGPLLLSARVAAAVVAVGVATALLCALAPVFTSRVMWPSQGLQSVGRAATAAPARQRLRALLIVSEIAVSFSLLTGAMVMIKTIVALTAVEWGVSDERVSVTGLALRQARYPDASARAAAFDRILTHLRTSPSVEAVALTTTSLVQQPTLVEAGASNSVRMTRAAVRQVTDGYFATLGIAILGGRPIGPSDVSGSEAVVVVSKTLARRLWSDRSALGQQLVTHEADAGGNTRRVVRVVVGVSSDVRQSATDDELADVYLSLLQAPGRFVQVISRAARGAGDAAHTAAVPIRRAVGDVDPEIAVDETRLLRDVLSAELTRPRFMTRLLATLAGFSVVLALVGVYGLVAYAVRHREREVAIRIAIGAQHGGITRLFLAQGSGVLVAGLLLGVAGAIGLGHVLETQAIGVATFDPAVLATGAFAFAVVALAAMWWPARLAAAVDPAIALRSD
jgi:putative ABC transport system permease protein